MSTSPEHVRISTAAAMTLKFVPGRFNRGEKLYALNLLQTYDEGCRARCAYCGLSDSRDPEEDSFIRVDWPLVDVNDVIERTNLHGNHLKRVCVSMITHARAFDDMCAIMERFRDDTELQISGLISPTMILDESQVRKIKDAGADMVGVAIDAALPEIFDEMRGKGVGGPHDWEHYWDVLGWCVDCFGKEKAGVHLIVGLGETEEEIIRTIQKAQDLGAPTHLFSFFPETGSQMENWPQPSYGQYRRVQLARHIINEKLGRCDDMGFNNKGQITDFGLEVEPIIADGYAFMTSGCPGPDGRVACNRPYGNERPSRPIRNFAFQPEEEDLVLVRTQLEDYGEEGA